MSPLTVTLLLVAVTLASAGSLPSPGGTNLRAFIARVRRETTESSGVPQGGKCSYQGQSQGTCVPFFFCDVDSLPDPDEEKEKFISSLDACKEAIELCCPESGILTEEE